MIRECEPADAAAIVAVINEAAGAYRGVIPADRWHEPYMRAEELAAELAAGVVFWGIEEAGRLVAVMGIQHVGDVALIRHAYTRTASQGRGLGTLLLEHLRGLTTQPMLVGTWAAATWAVRFYEGRGFRMVGPEEKARLLHRYWTIPARQIETSVVLADERWLARRPGDRSLAADDR
jgi:GNAT superfamily N-acetyltransferase